jgi:membrane fusion protein, heavy metal efflux system
MAATPTPHPPRHLITGLMAMGLCGLCGLWAPSHAAAPKPAGCLIEPDKVADVGSPVTGVIEQLPVSLGDAVRAGQTVVVLRADVERASEDAASTRAAIDAEVKAAQASVTMARQKEQRTRLLVQQAFLSEQALDEASAEASIAQQKLKLAQGQLRINAKEHAVTKAQLGLRTVRSPISGVVVERYNNLGERVEERPMLRIANIDTLRVSLMVPLAQYGQIKQGDGLLIRPELPGQPPVRATVYYIDKVVDAASNTFRVRLSLPNADHQLPGGLRCKAEWATAAAAAPAPTSPRPPVAASAVALTRMEPVTWTPDARVHLARPQALHLADGLTLKRSMTLSAAPRQGQARMASTDTRAAPLMLTLALNTHR